MPKRIEIAAGTVFNQLTYLYDVARVGSNRMGMFRCECGVKKSLPVNHVRTGRYKSCGCSHRVGKHGHCKNGKISSLHKRWGMMKQRCDNPNSADYHRYGGRGITICEEWYDFEEFSKWAERSGYMEHLSLDRKDNNKGYSPANCRWVTTNVQAANQNKTAGKRFKFIGVKQLPSGNWQAYIQHKGKVHSLGTYPSEKEAAIARNKYIVDNHLPHTINPV